MKHLYVMISILFFGATLLLTGCFEKPVKYTGGGKLDSVECGEEANVGFVYNGCKIPAMVNFVYQDRAADVKMKGGEIVDEISSDTIKVTYTSMNKDNPGDGVVKITLGDWGEGNEPHGFVKIKVLSGPFDDYENWSIVTGNVQKHACNEECDD